MNPDLVGDAMNNEALSIKFLRMTEMVARINSWANRQCETEKDLAIALEGVRHELRQVEIIPSGDIPPADRWHGYFELETVRFVEREGKYFCACHNLPVKLMSRQVLYLEGCPSSK